jgi:ADP-ribose pyrophosphatase YjhB (NUDIX family)
MSLAPDDREYPTRPWVGIGVVVWRNDEVLLIKRGRPPRRGEWGIPGGAQHLGETVFEAAIREVLEETGIAIRPTGIITVVDSILPDDGGRTRFHYTLIEVSADWIAGEILADSDAAAACWATEVQAARLVKWDETLRVIAMARPLRDILDS